MLYIFACKHFIHLLSSKYRVVVYIVATSFYISLVKKTLSTNPLLAMFCAITTSLFKTPLLFSINNYIYIRLFLTGTFGNSAPEPRKFNSIVNIESVKIARSISPPRDTNIPHWTGCFPLKKLFWEMQR